MNGALASLLVVLDVSAADICPDAERVLDDRVARRLMLWMIAYSPAPAPAAAVLARLAALHRRDIEGDAPDAGEWRSARTAAAALAGEADPDLSPSDALAEAAASTLAESPLSLLTETYAALYPVAMRRAVVATGWTTADERRATGILERLAASGLGREAIPGRFAVDEPDLERRFVAQLDAANRAWAGLRDEVVGAIRHLARPPARRAAVA